VPYDEKEQPEIKYDMVGAISKTTRFYGLADFQVLVDPKDEVYKIKSDLLNMDCKRPPPLPLTSEWIERKWSNCKDIESF